LTGTLGVALDRDAPHVAVEMILAAHPEAASNRIDASGALVRLRNALIVYPSSNLPVQCFPLHMAIVCKAAAETIFALLDASPSIAAEPFSELLDVPPLLLALHAGARKDVVLRLLHAHPPACQQATSPRLWNHLSSSGYGHLPRVLDRVGVMTKYGYGLQSDHHGVGNGQRWMCSQQSSDSYRQHLDLSGERSDGFGARPFGASIESIESSAWEVQALHLALSQNAPPDLVLDIVTAAPRAAAVGEPRRRAYWAAVSQVQTAAPQNHAPQFGAVAGFGAATGFGAAAPFGAVEPANDAEEEPTFGLDLRLHILKLTAFESQRLTDEEHAALNAGLGQLVGACFEAEPPPATDATDGANEGGANVGGANEGGANGNRKKERPLHEPAKLAAVQAYYRAVWPALRPDLRSLIELTLPDGFALRARTRAAASARGLVFDQWLSVADPHDQFINQTNAQPRTLSSEAHPLALAGYTLRNLELDEVEVRIHQSLPLHEALIRRYPPPVISALVDAHPAAVSICNASGWLPIELALEVGAPPEVLSALVSAGASGSIVSEGAAAQGTSAAGAAEDERKESLRLLDERMAQLQLARDLCMKTAP